MAGAAQHVGQLHWICAKGTDDKELFANCGGGRHAAFLSDERSVQALACETQYTIHFTGHIYQNQLLHAFMAGPQALAKSLEHAIWRQNRLMERAAQANRTDQRSKGSEKHRSGECS